jgi:rubrerythrin
MYQAFAKKADEEGYKGVASLFRAASAAEAIHRDNHAKVIRAMGATPQSNITNPNVGSTSENLQQAISGESYERDSMYPSFIKQVKAESNKAAVQTFNYAKTAEAQHAQLYTQAKNNLPKWRGRTQAFNVCTVSGETTMADNGKPKCPANGSEPLFKQVS